MDTPQEEAPEGGDEVVVVDINIDGRSVEYVLTDVISVRDQRYGTLYSEDDFLDPEDRTVFTRIVETEEGEDQFELLQDNMELDMVVANATISALEDLLGGVRSELAQVRSLLVQTDFAEASEDNRKVLGVILSKCANLLELLEQEGVEEEAESDE